MADRPTRPYIAAAILNIMVESTATTLFQEGDFEFHDSHLDTSSSDDAKFASATTDEISEALNHLVAQKFVEKLDDPYTRPDYFITDAGRVHLHQCYENPKSLEARYAKRGLAWLREALLNIHKNNHPFFSPEGGTIRVTEDGNIRITEGTEEGVFSDTRTEATDLPLQGVLSTLQSPSASSSPNFINATPSDLSGAVGGAPVVTYPVGGPSVPASNRYVSVKDNQTSFDELYEQLSRVKNEYARDHNRLAGEPKIREVLAETEATIAQINQGIVRFGQLSRGLIPTYEQACLALAAYPGLVQLLASVIHTAQQILRFSGIL